MQRIKEIFHSAPLNALAGFLALILKANGRPSRYQAGRRRAERDLGRFYAQKEKDLTSGTSGRGHSDENARLRTRWERWKEGVELSEKVIREMHGLSGASDEG